MTMRRNVGGLDRGVRLGLGSGLALLAALAPMRPLWRGLAGAAGGIALATGASQYCPLNQLLGVDTYRRSADWRRRASA